MAEIDPGSGASYLGLHSSDMNAEELTFHISIAEGPLDLRRIQEMHAPRLRLDEISKPLAVKLADTIMLRLYGVMGLGSNDSDDTRIQNLHRGVDLIKASDHFGPGRYHDTQRPETVFHAAYSRILSGMDPRSTDRLHLQPQEGLREVSLLQEMAASVLAFTGDEKYTFRHSYPRKAGRRITDVTSPYWGVHVGTDDYTGKTFGRDGYGPNVGISMPTGIVEDAAVLSLKANDHLRNGTWQETTGAGYVPDRMHVQHLRMGVAATLSDQVDTTSGFVARFLADAKNM